MEMNMIDMAINQLSITSLLAFGRELQMESFTGVPEPVKDFGACFGETLPTERRLLWIQVAVDGDCEFYEPWGCWDWEY